MWCGRRYGRTPGRRRPPGGERLAARARGWLWRTPDGQPVSRRVIAAGLVRLLGAVPENPFVTHMGGEYDEQHVRKY